MNDEPIILDLDGTTVDLLKGVSQFFGEVVDTNSRDAWGKLGLDTKERWAEIESLGPRFWYTLPAYDTTKALVNWARKNSRNVVVCSAPPTHFTLSGRMDCLKGKAEWLYANDMGDLPFVYTRNKKLLSTKGAWLIDDLERNCVEFDEGEGYAWLFPRDWNTHETKYRTRFDLKELV